MLFPFCMHQNLSPACTGMGALPVFWIATVWCVWMDKKLYLLRSMHLDLVARSQPASSSATPTMPSIRRGSRCGHLLLESQHSLHEVPHCPTQVMRSPLTTKSCISGKATQPLWAPVWSHGLEEYVAESCLPALEG